MAISQRTKEIRSALKEIVFPYLRSQGFKGSYPHFRRIGKDKVDLMSFQSSQWGGDFCVNLGIAPVEGVTWGDKLVPPNKLNAYHCENVRLAETEYFGDKWFGGEGTCKSVANEVLDLIKRRSDFIFNRMHRRNQVWKSLTPEQFSELEQIVKNAAKTRLNEAALYSKMRKFVLDYTDGTLVTAQKVFKTLTQEQIEAFEWKLRQTLRPCYLRTPKYKIRKYDKILGEFTHNRDEETALLYYYKLFYSLYR